MFATLTGIPGAFNCDVKSELLSVVPWDPAVLSSESEAGKYKFLFWT